MEDTPRARKRVAQKLVLSSSSSKEKKRAKFKDNENDDINNENDDDHPQVLPILDTSSSSSSDSSSSNDDDTLSLESEIISISDSSESDNDDSSVPSRAAYKLKRPKTPINVGDLVYAPWPGEDPPKEAWYWGTVVAHCWDDDPHFDIEFPDGDVSYHIWQRHLYALETKRYKDSILQCGDVVYAPYPGKEPRKESYFWGRISKIKIDKWNSTKTYDIHFFPSNNEKKVKVSKGLTSKYFQRQEESLYLMENGDHEDDPLPSTLQSLEDLIQREQEINNNESNTKPNKMARKNRAPKNTIRKKSTTPKKKENDKLPTNAKVTKDKPGRYGLSETGTIQVGDIVYAPYPGVNPTSETWYWGTVSKAYAHKNKDDKYFDIKFEGGDLSKYVWDKHIFKLESQEYKDSVLKEGDIVYAPFPGKQPKDEDYYWGTISKIFPASKSKKKPLLSYSIQFPDGDVTKKIHSEHFYRYKECTYLMKRGWLDNDKVPESLLSKKKR